MKRGVILLLFLTCICNGCIQRNKSFLEQWLDIINADYNEVKKVLPQNILLGFPNKLDSTVFGYMGGIGPYECTNIGFQISKFFDGEIIDSVNNVVYQANDTCLFVINRFYNKESIDCQKELSEDEKKIVNQSCLIGKKPIPNFWANNFATDSTECRLPKDFMIFVFDAAAGKFLPDEYLTNRDFMPDEWKHGYSRGMAFSNQKKVLIYWVEIW